MKRPGRVIDRDRGWRATLRGILDRAAGKDRLLVAVGIQGDEATADRGDGTTNVEIGTIHEFGAPKASIPMRSFIRAAVDPKASHYRKATRRIELEAFRGAPPEGALLQLGEEARTDIVDRIDSVIAPALKPATVERKQGEATPLIDSGDLKGSISVALRQGRVR